MSSDTANLSVGSYSLIDPKQPRPSGRVYSSMRTSPGAKTVAFAGAHLDINPDVIERAIEMYRSGQVAGVVFSGKMGCGKDTLAVKLNETLVAKEFAPAVVHATSDPIRRELGQAIALIQAAGSMQQGEIDVACAMGLSDHVAKHLAEELFPLTELGAVSPHSRTDLNRHLLVYLADEGRRAVDPTYWTKLFFAEVLGSIAEGNSSFLTGCRYPNEIIPAQALGILTVRIEVSPEVQAARLKKRDGHESTKEALENPNECALDSFSGFNLVVGNDDSFEPTIRSIAKNVDPHVSLLRSL
jgi:thymidylate kinase